MNRNNQISSLSMPKNRLVSMQLTSLQSSLDSTEKQQQLSPSLVVLTARLPFSLQVNLDSLH